MKAIKITARAFQKNPLIENNQKQHNKKQVGKQSTNPQTIFLIRQSQF
ncbi:hypothetical protein SAMN04487910_2895 [Aquimarina amphilecti]|uniref:Uncharacterized protein n=1 Tax=Aquimarina amphilecti TaxID=1038014 RepID=A0A1H7RVQ4_AQUAM|nr:hypothetical protein SAMN04487910_2895 [Aquimarina amphilecti]